MKNRKILFQTLQDISLAHHHGRLLVKAKEQDESWTLNTSEVVQTTDMVRTVLASFIHLMIGECDRALHRPIQCGDPDRLPRINQEVRLHPKLRLTLIQVQHVKP